MLSNVERKKLKSVILELKEKLIISFENYASSKYFLGVSDPKKREKELKDKNPIAYYEWQLISKKLESDGISFEDYILERSYTYLNRTFFLMRMEFLGIQKHPVFKGMKNSSGWKEFQLFAPNLCREEDEGFLFLTRIVSDYYARELPGLFLDDSADRAFGAPGQMVFELYQKWNLPELENIFKDETSAGWIYQYWNDPDREKINDKVKNKGKVLGKELASATQLFTERYMVEWLIQNSLGNLWLAICKKNQWETSATEVISKLNKRREDHNAKIDRKTITEDSSLPIFDEEEEYWKYYLHREITEEEVASAIGSIREVKVLDPACGSGHFLLYAFVFLFYLYKEEDRIRKAIDSSHSTLSDLEIAKSILENNLFGIDLDPRAVQIAVASLYSSARIYGELQLSHLNLVATRPSIGSSTSPKAIAEFIDQFCKETNTTKELAKALIELLGKSDVLGSLLQIRTEIRNQLNSYSLYEQGSEESIFSKLEEFVKKHDIGNDLGLFTLGRQLSRGLRLLRLLDQKYDVVVANPPYLSAGKVGKDLEFIFTNESSELYEAFIYNFKNNLKKYGFFSLLTAHNFLFIDKFEKLRAFILKNYSLNLLSQLGVWTFKEISQPGALGFACFILQYHIKENKKSYFMRIGSGNFRKDPYDKEAYLLNQPPKRIYHFDQSKFADIEGSPMIYWWTESFRQWYLGAEKLGDVGETLAGSTTSNNARYLRKWYEIKVKNIYLFDHAQSSEKEKQAWVPYLKGSKGERWFEKLNELIIWENDGKQVKANSGSTIASPQKYFKQGIAYSYIGVDDFFCRLRKYQSIFDVSGSTVFTDNAEFVQVALSSRIIPFISQSINPTINNQVGDIKNLPIPKVEHWKDYIDRARVLYDEEFTRDETNVEYEYRGEV